MPEATKKSLFETSDINPVNDNQLSNSDYNEYSQVNQNYQEEHQETNNPPVDEQEDFNSWDKDKAIKAYQNLQRKNNALDNALRRADEERIRFEERLKLIEERTTMPPVQQKQVEPEPVIPTRPNRPTGYNRADAIAYPDSDSAKYEIAMEDYYAKREARDAWEKKQIADRLNKYDQDYEARKNAEIQNQEFAQRKAAQIARLARANGGDIKEATEVFDFVQASMAKDDPMWYINLFRNAKNITKNDKSQQIDNRNARQNGFAPSPANFSSDNDSNQDFDRKFMGELSKKNNKHSLFETIK